MQTLDVAPLLAVRLSAVARMLGQSSATIRRRVKDSDFPKPFRLTPNGDLLWLVADIHAHISAKASQPRAV